MNLAALAERQGAVRLLQRSLENGRLAHAYLFSGSDLAELETAGRLVAKTLCCEQPRRGAAGLPIDCCDACNSCRKVDEEAHPDVIALRPESRMRIIKIEQIRELLDRLYLKPTQAPFKVALIVAAERLNVNAANAFLKTLEEPPADVVLVLLTTDLQRIIDTILSRCQRLDFSGETRRHRDPAMLEWLGEFSSVAATPQKSLLTRYRLLSVLLARLTTARESIEEAMTKRSPLERHDDLEPELREKWEVELSAAIEAEYRRQRGDLLAGLQWWLRDVWLQVLRIGGDLLSYPEFAESSRAVASRLDPQGATENLELLDRTQRLLDLNVQEALALEVGLLKLRL
jgi:DNA polymerase-3 subunit delta'